jgi:hypothetical protein
VVVIFGAPYWVQCYLAVRVDDCCPVFVMVFLFFLVFMLWLTERELCVLHSFCTTVAASSS